MLRRLLLTILCLVVLASTCLAADPVAYVRRGTFHQCPYRTVGDAVDSGFQNAHWTSGTADDGQKIVNVEGIVTYGGKRYRALMQFGLKPGGSHVNGLSMNGQLMDTKFKDHFITELCR
jgi:hypothetical protein